jgi:hypothetical protein
MIGKKSAPNGKRRPNNTQLHERIKGIFAVYLVKAAHDAVLPNYQKERVMSVLCAKCFVQPIQLLVKVWLVVSTMGAEFWVSVELFAPFAQTHSIRLIPVYTLKARSSSKVESTSR